MSKIMKKFSALLLTLAMVLTMMPALAQPSYAEDESAAISAYVNGVSLGTSVSQSWLEENALDAQVFPFAAKQGQNWGYIIAQGPSYELVLKELTGIESLEDISNASIVWRTAAGEEVNNKNGWNTLYVEDLINAKDQFKLIDADTNEDIIGAFDDSPANVKVAPIENSPEVNPIVATKQSKLYEDYASAVAALDGEWQKSTNMRPYLGGNLDKDEFVKTAEGGILGGSVNFTGRFSLADNPQINIKIAAVKTNKALTFTTTTAKQIALSNTDKEIEYLGGVTWKSSDTKIATVSSSGKVTPKGIGSCTVTATTGTGELAAECKVTVKTSAFKPDTPKSFKVTNVKTRSAKLTWKKVSNASGYEIYRSTKKTKGFKKVASVKKSVVKYTNKKLTKNKVYYYKIRSYRTVNGKKVYGSYTNVKPVKIRK